MMWGFDGFGFGGGAMGIGMLLFWVVIIAVIVMLFGRLGGQSGHALRTTPQDILRERYARGEIDRTEFEQKRSELGSS